MPLKGRLKQMPLKGPALPVFFLPMTAKYKGIVLKFCTFVAGRQLYNIYADHYSDHFRILILLAFIYGKSFNFGIKIEKFQTSDMTILQNAQCCIFWLSFVCVSLQNCLF